MREHKRKIMMQIPCLLRCSYACTALKDLIKTHYRHSLTDSYTYGYLDKNPFELPYMVHVCTSPVVAIPDNFVQFYCSFAQHWTKLIEIYKVVHFKLGEHMKKV